MTLYSDFDDPSAMKPDPAFNIDEAKRLYSDQWLDGSHVPGMSDEIGERVLILDDQGAPSLELLRFRQTLTTIPGFEVALRRRVERLRQFRHAAFSRTPAVEYLGRDHGLALLSSYTPGKRLSEVLAHAQDRALAASLIHQLAPALDALNDYGGGVGHGALTPSRIVISPEGQLIVVEHVLGSALERLHLTVEGMRLDLGIPVPAADGAQPQTDGTTDCFQLALIALSILLGRALNASDYSELEERTERGASKIGSRTRRADRRVTCVARASASTQRARISFVPRGDRGTP